MLNSGRGNTPEGKPTSAPQLRCESSCSLGDKAGESRTETATTSGAPSSGLLGSSRLRGQPERTRVERRMLKSMMIQYFLHILKHPPEAHAETRYMFFMDIFEFRNAIRTVISFLGMKNPRPSDVSGLARQKSTSQHHSPQGSCLNTLCFLPHTEGYYFPPKLLVVWLFLNIQGPH